MTQRGVGPETALAFVLAIGDVRRLSRTTGRNPQTEEGAKTGNPGEPVPVQSGAGAKPNPE